ncbi:MAG: N-acetylmuramoyl-L-alanine amidase [Bdellovibrionales bacterium]
MIQKRSPNFNERAPGSTIRYVIVHYTGMPTPHEALDRLCDPESQVSAHYVIAENGVCLPLVDETGRAWHAGKSFWRGQTDLNSLSIGIELVNKGHAHGYHPFPEAQINALIALLGDLYERYKLSPASLLGHSDIAPSRREDPGELFPWQQLAKAGYGLWPEKKDSPAVLLPEAEINALLRTVGYECPDEEPTLIAAARRAFCRHYHPERLTLGFDAQTCARLKNLADQTSRTGVAKG